MEPNQWNTAAVREWELVELLNDIDIATMADHPQFTEWFTDDFVREDRRGLTGAPTVDALGFVDQMRAWFEIGAGAPTFAPREVVAVAGDRLVVIRISVSFSGENEVEMLHLVLMDEQVVRQQRIISFDVEAHDLAGDRAGVTALLAENRTSILADPLAGFRAVMDTAPPADQEIMNDPDWQTAFIAAVSESLRPEVDGWVDEGEAIALRWDDIDLQAVACSITWWHGTDDRNAPLSAARRLVDQLPTARLVVWDEGGHFTGYRKEAEILDDLLARCSPLA